MEALKSFGAGILGFGVMILIGLAAGFYIHAASVGIEEGFGWDGWWVVAVLVLMVTMRIGIFFIVAAGAYGAFYGWDWQWWSVLLVFFPFLTLGLAGGLLATLYGGFQMLTGRDRAKSV